MKRCIITAVAALFFTAAVMMAMPGSVCAASPETDAEALRPDDVIKSSVTAYRNLSNWNGKEISTGIKCEDIFDFTVTSHGGIVTDGEGRLSFANYATVSIALKTADASMSIPGMTASIKSERDYAYDGMHVGENRIIHLDTMVGYGVILTTCEAADGTREQSEEMYIRYYNDRVNDIRITKDGNYRFTILMTVKEGKDTKKLAFEYIVPIRTSVYVTDESGEYHVKNAGAYYAPARLDALDRPGVELRVNGTRVEDGYVIRDIGKYKIDVYGNGFLCESFNYEIFSAGSGIHIYLSNVRARIDDISYECENNFKVSWYSANGAQMTYWRDNDHEKIFTYTEGTVITEPGHYVFTLTIPSQANTKMSFLVKLAPDDSPSLNKNTLQANRFNNFRSKWYEVYDSANGLYYCFAMSEYITAYDAAMTVERARTVDYGHYVLYNNVKYTDKVALTRAMANAAAANVRTVYYDPAAEKIEKYFSDRAFDGTVYLNLDYVFARVSPAETNKVYLTDEHGNRTDVDFFTPISSYGLASGLYTVTEEDLYGNRTEYTVTVDSERPIMQVNVGGELITASDRSVYTGRYFALEMLLDKLDSYALVSVTREGEEQSDYYLADECNGAVYTESGMYTVRAYDRNGNSSSFIVSLGGARQWELEQTESGAKVSLAPGAAFAEIYENGVKTEPDASARELFFERTETDRRIVIYTKNTVGGESDCVSFTVRGNSSGAEEEPEGTPGGNITVNSGNESGISPDALIITVCAASAIVCLAAVIVIVFVWRRRD